MSIEAFLFKVCNKDGFLNREMDSDATFSVTKSWTN